MPTPRKPAAESSTRSKAIPAEHPVPPAPLQYQTMRPHFTPAERVSRDKANRRETPRRSQGFWEPWPNRPDPVTLLEEQATTPWDELVPIRHGRMLASPFALFRGSAYIMASDLATTPRTGIKVQACGDAHLVNFGIFPAPDRSLVFETNAVRRQRAAP